MSFELPDVVGDAELLIAAGGRFHVACTETNRWSVRRERDPHYLGELRYRGGVFDYEARTREDDISLTQLSLLDWIKVL
jgi:hypothetical protein